MITRNEILLAERAVRSNIHYVVVRLSNEAIQDLANRQTEIDNVTATLRDMKNKQGHALEQALGKL